VFSVNIVSLCKPHTASQSSDNNVTSSHHKENDILDKKIFQDHFLKMSWWDYLEDKILKNQLPVSATRGQCYRTFCSSNLLIMYLMGYRGCPCQAFPA
jgi:hypothetical protein